jgi:RNA polymerase sigma-54 factor
MNQTLQTGMSTQLGLTQEMQHFFRLLQLSTLELHEELQTAVADNPLLERDDSGPETLPARLDGAGREEFVASTTEAPADESPLESIAEIDCFDASHPLPRNDDGEESEFLQQTAGTPSLRDHLIAQLGMTRLCARDKSMVAALIATLDESGYLSESLESIAELLRPEVRVEPRELEIALKHLQNFDPVGVGARTPGECLELQLRALRPDTPERGLAIAIVRNYLAEFAARDFAALKRHLHCDDMSLARVRQLILRLDPRPGAQYESVETRYIVPDVIVKKVKNKWIAGLNPDAVPKLRINSVYAELLQDMRNTVRSPMSKQLTEARWLIRNVEARFQTILRVAQAIVDQQCRFFEHGESAMQPLMQREIASAIGVHRSTISRVTRQKFMATPRGVFELKYFFGSEVATESGGTCSTTAIRAILKQLVLAEDRTKPLSDSKIVQILGRHGVVVARRTIAKYRDSMHVPPANLRMAM